MLLVHTFVREVELVSFHISAKSSLLKTQSENNRVNGNIKTESLCNNEKQVEENLFFNCLPQTLENLKTPGGETQHHCHNVTDPSCCYFWDEDLLSTICNSRDPLQEQIDLSYSTKFHHNIIIPNNIKRFFVASGLKKQYSDQKEADIRQEKQDSAQEMEEFALVFSDHIHGA
jgi:hypothetical protein